MAADIPVIAWDYQFAPNAQKARSLLYASGIPFQQCEQPFVLPRPILNNLGITYRRVPVLSIGKDLYCDNRSFMDAVMKLKLGEKAGGKKLVESPADSAFEQFGYRTFWVGLGLVPASLVTKDLSSDRLSLFSIFSRPDFAEIRPNALGEFKALLDTVEHEFLGHGGPWINGDKCGLADIHAMWMIKWALQTLDVAEQPGFGKGDFPKVYRWIEGIPPHNQEDDKLTEEDATKKILASSYAAADVGVDEKDPLGLHAGATVAVEASDADPGTYPQLGKLVGLSRRECVVELGNSLRLHFPRLGYTIKKA